MRGFVRTVSSAIGLDAEDTVARMLSEPAAEGLADRISMGRVALGVALALGALLVLALAPGILELRSANPATSPPAAATLERADESEVRRDAVRALAAAAGLLPEAAGNAASEAASDESSSPAAGAP